MFTALLLSVVSCSEKPAEPQAKPVVKEYERADAVVRLVISADSVTVAEQISVSIEAVVAEGIEVKLPILSDKLGEFDIVDRKVTMPQYTTANRVRSAKEFVLEPFLAGNYVIEPLTVTVTPKDGAPFDIITDQVEVEVASLLADAEQTELNEIKPPVDLPVNKMIFVWLTVAILLIAAVITAAVLTRKKKIEEIQSIPDPAHVIAYRELDVLAREDLPGQGLIKQFYQRVSGVLRHYIEDRFALRAPEQTTEEFLYSLRSNMRFDGRYLPLLESFLQHCDLVKFAEHKPTKEDINDTFESCKNFVDETREEVRSANPEHPVGSAKPQNK